VRPTRLLSGLSSVALVVLGLVALLPDCASACSCVPPPPGQSQQEQARRELDRSSAVFAGEVVDRKRGVGTFYGRTPRIEMYKVSFRVSEVWKGPERETLEVSTPSQGPACGYRFSEGREYLVYADGKKMIVTGCGRTTLLSKASADLQALGNGETLAGSGVLYDTSGGFPPLGVIGMVGGAVAAVSLVVLMRLVRTG
jgi:hypothetical protein